jgi:hypothetical protein
MLLLAGGDEDRVRRRVDLAEADVVLHLESSRQSAPLGAT